MLLDLLPFLFWFICLTLWFRAMTEDRANEIFSSVQDIFYDKYKNENGIKYLALVKKSDFYFELGVGKGVSEERLNEIKNDIQKYFPRHKKFFRNIKGILNQKGFLIDFESTNIDTNNKIDDFNFHQKKTFYGSGLKCPKGSVLRGTVGAVIESTNSKDDLYFITNHHVISTSGQKKGALVYNINNEVIGEFAFSIFDCYYDIAFIKILSKDVLNHNDGKILFGELKPPSFNTSHIIGKGFSSKYNKEKSYIYSTKAIVKVSDKWFKNQILIDDLDFEHGDSGSVLTKKNNFNKPNDVIGLYIGGNNRLSVANNIYELFSTPVTNQNSKDKIIFKSFIN